MCTLCVVGVGPTRQPPLSRNHRKCCASGSEIDEKVAHPVGQQGDGARGLALRSQRLHIAHWIRAEHAGHYRELESTPEDRLGLASHRSAVGRAHGPKRSVDAGWPRFTDSEPAAEFHSTRLD